MDDAHQLTIALLTLGDPDRLTGGNRFHRRIADLAPSLGARLLVDGIPERPPGAAQLCVGRAFARAREAGAACVLLDSLAAAEAAPWLSVNRPTPPVIGMLHQPPGGIDGGPMRIAVRARLDRLAYRRAIHLIAASRALGDELVSLGVAPAGRVSVVAPGRDPVEPEPGEPDDLRRGRRCAVLCAANWLERKGILDLLEAVAELPPGAATLHLAGDEAADPHYARLVRARLGAADLRARVAVHGVLPQPRLAALYRDADVFALPSLREPYGTVYGEAMSFGLPVVGWRAGNLVHLADDGVEGLLVEPGDVRGLAAALRRLSEDEPLRRRLGDAARARAASLPTWEDSTRLLIDTVRLALARE